MKTEVKTPATGIIQKSNEKSFFLKFHQGSPLSKDLFDLKPKYMEMEVSVIQVMLIGEGYLLAECVKLVDNL